MALSAGAWVGILVGIILFCFCGFCFIVCYGVRRPTRFVEEENKQKLTEARARQALRDKENGF